MVGIGSDAFGRAGLTAAARPQAKSATPAKPASPLMVGIASDA
jgi:hypothetical protein